MTDNDKPMSSGDEAARDADLKRREDSLSDKLDDLEKQVKPGKPKAPPIGAMF